MILTQTPNALDVVEGNYFFAYETFISQSLLSHRTKLHWSEQWTELLLLIILPH
jgi:hypothetical protein